MAKKKAQPKLSVEWVSVDLIRPYPGNPRKNQPIESVAESIERVGWVQPIVTDKSGEIIIGDTRYRAALLRGWSEVPIFRHSGLTKAKAQALRLADNRLGEAAAWDKLGLLAELESIAKSEGIAASGFDLSELESLQASLSGKRERPEVPFSEELGESNNYIVLQFSNEVDWLNARSHFGLDSRYSKRQNGKPWAKGIGRVVDGAAYLDSIQREWPVIE